MSTDNRTLLNDAEATTGWTGDDAVTAVTDSGLFYQGSTALATQLSNADEHMYTTSIGGTRDLSDAQVYLLVKDNLIDSQANGGAKIVLHDGTNRIGYEIGGYDEKGLDLPFFYSCYKLDVSNSAAFTGHVFAGVEANLTESAITGVGYGSLHLSKAQGASDNTFIDASRFIANDSYALTINGGTVGTPETMADVQGDDQTSGWGMVSNPQGAQFNIFAPTEWGTPSGTADSYFQADNEQWYLLGQGMGAGHFIFRVIGNGTGTNSFVLNSVSIVGLGEPAIWSFSDTNMDAIKLTAVNFTDCGTFVFQAQDATNKFLETVVFNNCGQVDPSTMDFDNVTFNGTTDANGALRLDEATASNMSNLTFNSDGTGHAIHVNPTGAGPFTYTFDNWKFNDYATNAGTSTDRSLYIDPATSSANITINIINNGDTPSFREAAGYTGTVTINNTVTVKATFRDGDNGNAPIQNVRVLIEADSGGDLPAADSVTITSSGTTASVSHTAHGLVSGDQVVIRGANEDPYNGIFTISNVTANAYDYTMGSSTTSPATGTITSTAVIISALTNASGVVQNTGFGYTSDQPITGKGRKNSPGDTRYVQGTVTGTILSTGADLTIVMNQD